MTVDAPKPTDAEIAEAHAAALAHAEKAAGSRAHWETQDVAQNAATNAILWAIANYTPDRVGESGFAAFANQAVRRFVSRGLHHLAVRLGRRPKVVSLSGLEDDGFEIVAMAAEAGEIPLPEAVRELPEELRDAVRLFYIDKFTTRECAMLMGCSHETVRQRLERAAKLLLPDQPKPRRKHRERRIKN